jgi:hypothetical protein
MEYGYSLASLAQSCEKLRQVEKARLHPGDLMYVQTKNSSYAIRTLDDGYFEISGGWFDREGGAPQKLRINGCTWGGTCIKTDIAAACGLCMEIGFEPGQKKKRLVTSPIQKIFIVPSNTLS